MNRKPRIVLMLVCLFVAGEARAAGWTAAPPLNHARELFGTAVDECGNIWVVGGWNRTGGCSGGTGPMVNSVEKLTFNGSAYLPQWELTGINIPIPRTQLSVAISQSYLYVLGGLADRFVPPGAFGLTQVDRYDFQTGTWSSVDVPPTAPRHDGAAVVDRRGRIWFIGGQATNGGPILNTVQIFDPGRPALGWQDGPAMNRAHSHCGATIDEKGRIWVTGGTGVNDHEQTIEYIDPCGNNTWMFNTNNIPSPTTNDDQCTIGADGKIYIVGGWIAHTWFNRTLRLRPDSGVMDLWAPLIQARSQHRVVMGHDKYIYAIAGDVSGCVSTTSCEKLYAGPARPEVTSGPE